VLHGCRFEELRKERKIEIRCSLRASSKGFRGDPATAMTKGSDAGWEATHEKGGGGKKKSLKSYTSSYSSLMRDVELGKSCVAGSGF